MDYLNRYYKIDVVTTCGDDKDLRANRIENLENHFGKHFFNEIYTLPYSSSKKDTYKLYKDIIVIDDEIRNCVDALDCGHTVFKLQYNQLIKKIMKYDNFNNTKTKQIKPYTWKKVIKQLKSNAR